ncbi:MAG: hypothetical protein KDA84_07575 [Planctomycetaceae bacterium]|nr:hypothetical protein [Planctomycetaceae bacterium]
MADLDEKLFSFHHFGPYSDDEWREILSHVVSKLEVFLGQPVETSDMQFFPNGPAGDIASPTTALGLFQLSWFGRIGVTVTGDQEATDLSARIFFRGFGKRLVAIDGKAFLYLGYRKWENENYEWRAEWDEDIYGEFEHWE